MNRDCNETINKYKRHMKKIYKWCFTVLTLSSGQQFFAFYERWVGWGQCFRSVSKQEYFWGVLSLITVIDLDYLSLKFCLGSYDRAGRCKERGGESCSAICFSLHPSLSHSINHTCCTSSNVFWRSSLWWTSTQSWLETSYKDQKQSFIHHNSGSRPQPGRSEKTKLYIRFFSLTILMPYLNNPMS